MEQGRIVEDRVFGRPETYPPLPIAVEPSKAFDLMSITVEEAETVYAVQGTVNHPPLVFLHGWGASHKFWRWAFTAFAPRYRCIAPDLPGFGLSEKPRRDYSMEAYAGWLGKFLDALGYSRVTLVGHSMGGTVALLFALDHPERLEKLALVNPLLQGSSAFSKRTRFLLLPGVRRFSYAMTRARRFRRWITRDFTYVRPLDPELEEDVGRGTYRSETESTASMLRTDLTPRLPELKVPTLSVGTDHDRVIITPQHEWVPARRTALLREAGHIPLVERPAEFNAVLDAFLRDV